MHIVFATLYDPRDPRRGSGTFYFLSRELERQGHRVDYVGPIDFSRLPLVSRLLRRTARFLGQRYRSFQDVFVARRIGKEVGRRLRGSEADVLLTNDYSIAGYTPCHLPVALYTDTIFPRRYRDVKHPWLTDLFAPNVLSCQHVNRKGLQRSVFWGFPSDWAVDEALGYGIPGGRSRATCIEFGANFFTPPSAEVAARRAFAKVAHRGRLRLLFVGNRDWELKGGDVAVATAEELRRRGLDVRLDLVGAPPPEPLAQDWIRVHGVIDKVEDPDRLGELYTACDLLLVPSKGEGFGVTFVEAAAYGLPSLSYDSGTGVNNAVRHGKSGFLLPLDRGPEAFAERIRGFYDEPALYDRMARDARAFHESVANWPRAAERLVEAIAARLPAGS